MNASLRSVAMFLLSDREGCEVYVVCRAVLSVCLVTDWFSRSQHCRPSLEKSHCRVCVSSGARDAIRQDASQLLRSLAWHPECRGNAPKCPSPVAVRSGFRLPQDLQGSIIWWLPSAQFMLYMRENYASRIYDSRELDQRFFLTPLKANTWRHFNWYLWIANTSMHSDFILYFGLYRISVTTK